MTRTQIGLIYGTIAGLVAAACVFAVGGHTSAAVGCGGVAAVMLTGFLAYVGNEARIRNRRWRDGLAELLETAPSGELAWWYHGFTGVAGSPVAWWTRAPALDERLWDAVVEVIERCGYRVEWNSELTGGVLRWEHQLIELPTHTSGIAALKTMLHELAHLTCGHRGELYHDLTYRARWEAEAETIASLVLRRYGIDSRAASCEYVAGWLLGDTEMLRRSALMAAGIAEMLGGAIDDVITETNRDEAISA